MQDVLEKFLTASVLFMPRVLGSLAILATFWIAPSCCRRSSSRSGPLAGFTPRS